MAMYSADELAKKFAESVANIIAAKDKRIAELERLNELQRQTINKCWKAFKDTNTADYLSTTCEEAVARIAELEKEVEENKASWDMDLMAELAEANTRVKELEKELAEAQNTHEPNRTYWRQRAGVLEDRLAEARETIEQLEEKFGGEIDIEKIEVNGKTIIGWKMAYNELREKAEGVVCNSRRIYHPFSGVRYESNVAVEKEFLDKLREALERGGEAQLIAKEDVDLDGAIQAADKFESLYRGLRAKAEAVIGSWSQSRIVGKQACGHLSLVGWSALYALETALERGGEERDALDKD